MARIFIAGRSHVYAMKEAARGRADSNDFAVARWGEDDPRGSDRYTSTEELRGVALSLKPGDVFAISYLGMNHSAMGLLKHPIEFDFFHDGQADDSAEIIPRRLVDAALARRSTKWRMFHTLIRKTRAKVVFVSTPPPKSDNAFLRQQAVMADTHAEEIAAPALRLKLWRSEREIVRSLSHSYGAVFLDPPPEATTSDGFLNSSFYEDALHANAAYGSLVLDQLRSLLPAPVPPPPPPVPSALYRRWRKVRAGTIRRFQRLTGRG